MSSSPILAAAVAPASANLPDSTCRSSGTESSDFLQLFTSARADVSAGSDGARSAVPGSANAALPKLNGDASASPRNSEFAGAVLSDYRGDIPRPAGGNAKTKYSATAELVTRSTRKRERNDQAGANAAELKTGEICSNSPEQPVPISAAPTIAASCTQDLQQVQLPPKTSADSSAIPGPASVSGVSLKVAQQSMIPDLSITELSPATLNDGKLKAPAMESSNTATLADILTGQAAPTLRQSSARPEIQSSPAKKQKTDSGSKGSRRLAGMTIGSDTEQIPESGLKMATTEQSASPSENGKRSGVPHAQNNAHSTPSRKVVSQVTSQPDDPSQASEKTRAVENHASSLTSASALAAAISSPAQPVAAVTVQHVIPAVEHSVVADPTRDMNVVGNIAPAAHVQSSAPAATAVEPKIEAYPIADPPRIVTSGQLHVGSNSSELKISVQLPELGKVDVRTITSHDVTTAHLTASRHDVLQALVAGRNDLEQTLRSRDVILGSLQSHTQHPDSQRQSAGQRQAQNYSAPALETPSTSSSHLEITPEEFGVTSPLPDYSRISVRA